MVTQHVNFVWLCHILFEKLNKQKRIIIIKKYIIWKSQLVTTQEVAVADTNVNIKTLSGNTTIIDNK